MYIEWKKNTNEYQIMDIFKEQTYRNRQSSFQNFAKTYLFFVEFLYLDLSHIFAQDGYIMNQKIKKTECAHFYKYLQLLTTPINIMIQRSLGYALFSVMNFCCSLTIYSHTFGTPQGIQYKVDSYLSVQSWGIYIDTTIEYDN